MNSLLRTLNDKTIDNKVRNIILVFFILSFIAYTPSAYAIDLDFPKMIENLAKAAPEFMRLVTATGYIIGIFMIFRCLYALKQYGELRTMMSSQTDLRGPIFTLLAGVMLLYLPSSVQVGLETFWRTSVPYAYTPETDQSWSKLIASGLSLIQVIGAIAFIRGWILLSNIGSHSGGQPGTIGKGITHIVAGIIMINMYGFVKTVQATLGVSY